MLRGSLTALVTPFDQGGRNNHGRLNGGRRFGLTRNSLDRLATDAADTKAHTEQGKSGPEAGTQLVETGQGGGLCRGRGSGTSSRSLRGFHLSHGGGG